MPSDKIQRLAVAIRGLERKIAAASDEIDRKYPHVRGTCCQSCYYGAGGYSEAVEKQDRRMEWLRELKRKMVNATGYTPEIKMKCAKCGGTMRLKFVSDNPTMGIAYNVYSCDDCLTICREDVWKNAGKTWITGDGTISRGNETILPMVAMVRIEDLSSGEWIRQGANVWQVAKACAPDQNTRMLELKQGPTTYKVRMSLATMVERVQQTEEQ